MKNKGERLAAIRRKIEQNEISSQEDLLQMLIADGYDITQATMSRDLKSLQIIKAPGSDGKYIYTIPNKLSTPEEVSTGFPVGGFKNIEFSGNLGIIKTLPGFAMGIASVIDAHKTYEIMGTIAGDDTILLILREGIPHTRVKEILSGFIPVPVK